MRSTIGKHHFLSRKIKLTKKKKYKLLDNAIYLAGIIGLLMTLPQLIKIWMYQDASGVSALSWGTYVLIAITWLVYGTIHKQKPIIVTNCFWIVMDLAIMTGAIIY
jgi:uncharacterized protein with PQ loop repeat